MELQIKESIVDQKILQVNKMEMQEMTPQGSLISFRRVKEDGKSGVSQIVSMLAEGIVPRIPALRALTIAQV